jgi:hypothetical protein
MALQEHLQGRRPSLSSISRKVDEIQCCLVPLSKSIGCIYAACMLDLLSSGYVVT